MLDGHDHVVRRIADACALGDVAALAAVLADRAVAVCDGGGRVSTPLHPVVGADDVARLVLGLLSGRPGTDLAVEAVNGRAGLVLRRAGTPLAVAVVSVTGAEATVVWIILNPDKLRGWHRTGS